MSKWNTDYERVLGACQGIKISYKTVGRRGMYIVKAEADQIEKIVDMSIRAFETDVNVGGIKGDCPPGFDSIEWHKQMAREGHLYQAMIEKDLVGAAIVFPDLIIFRLCAEGHFTDRQLALYEIPDGIGFAFSFPVKDEPILNLYDSIA